MNTNVMEGINEAPTSMLLLLLFCFVFLPFILIYFNVITTYVYIYIYIYASLKVSNLFVRKLFNDCF